MDGVSRTGGISVILNYSWALSWFTGCACGKDCWSVVVVGFFAVHKMH
jgi:hypothetical protein